MNLSGPTSFAPIINKSIEIIKSQAEGSPDSKMSYHILFIIADGSVSDRNQLSTMRSIVEASNYPLSIVIIGVGDGPFDNMVKFDNRLCNNSKFDNLNFVDYNQTTKNTKTPELSFGLKAFMEIPEQYRLIKKKEFSF